MVEALVINLSTSVERWEFQERQLSLLGIVAIRLEAATPLTLDPEAGDAYWYGWRKEMSPVEKAILCSHRKCWQVVAERNQPFLILEDDAVLSPSIRKICESLLVRGDIDYVQLETVPGPKLVSEHSVDNFPDLRRLSRDNGGSAAYWITPKGARILLKSTAITPMPADDAISFNLDLKKFQADPGLAHQAIGVVRYSLKPPSFMVSGRKATRFKRTANRRQKILFFVRKWRFWILSRSLIRNPPQGFEWRVVPAKSDIGPFSAKFFGQCDDEDSH